MISASRITSALAVLIVGMGEVPDSNAAIVDLQNATATYSQINPDFPGLWSASKTIDGTRSGAFTSWAIARCEGSPVCGNTHTKPETIVWETKHDLTVNATTPLEFKLYHGDFVPSPDHNLGRFRLSYTRDDRSLFADGMDNGGDVSANWVVIDPVAFSSTTGETFTKLGDSSLLVSGGSNFNSTYRIAATLAAAGITGFRLEALEDSSLPFSGPGRATPNGNFALSEFQLTTVPVPASLWLISSGVLALFGLARSRRIQ